MDASPLNQFVVLAQSVHGSCATLVKQALEHSGVFVFGELLDCANVQALGQDQEGKKLLELLRIFAYGTYPDYTAHRAELPELTAGQRRKLQLLTVVSLATQKKVIQFSDLQSALDVATEREVEDIIIEACYQNLIVGKMDQESRCLNVESSACRDCRDQDVDFIIDTLTAWHQSADKMLGSLDGMVQFSRESFDKQKTARDDLEKKIEKTRESLKEGDGPGRAGSGGASGGSSRMQTDDADEESRRARGRGRWMGGLAPSRGK